MHLFLTSSPSGALDEPNYDKLLDNRNGFVDALKALWKPYMKGLIIAADAYAFASNDEQLDFFNQAFRNSGVSLDCFDFYDARTTDMNPKRLHSYDMIMLSGGHVPTQNAFFKQIQLREMLEGYDGIVIGVSAGSMNSADVVYVQPEEEGESIDPNFIRYTQGLNLTKYNILPHYQMVKDRYLDGRRLFEDITYADSYGHCFVVLVDGSFVYEHEEIHKVFGECYLLSEGNLSLYCHYNEQREL